MKRKAYALERASATQASIRGEESEQVELRQIRRETPEEHALNRPDGLREAILIVASFLFFLFQPDWASCLYPHGWSPQVCCCSPPDCGDLCPAASRRAARNPLPAGVPKRWGLFGETIRSKSITSRWALSISSIRATGNPGLPGPGQQTDIDIYLNRHVARQGRYLSLHDEVKTSPLQYWLRSAIYRRRRPGGGDYAVGQRTVEYAV